MHEHDRTRQNSVLLLLVLAVITLLAGIADPSRAAQPSSEAPTTSSAPPAGAPAPGLPATRGVVNLHTLPPAPAVKGTTALPFRYPGGPAALAAAQAKARNWPADPNLARALSPLTFGAPSIVSTFRGIDFDESGCGCLPPDGDMAAGPNHVVVGVNTAFRVFNKSGSPLTGVIDFNTFFGSCGAPGLNPSDP